MAEVYPKKVTTTFSVSFSIAFDGLLKAEVDDRDSSEDLPLSERGKNKTTSFIPGDTVWCLVYTGKGVTIKESITTLGNFSPPSVCGGTDVKKVERVTFQGPDGLTQTLGYPIKSGATPSLKFYGKSMPWSFDEVTNTVTAVSAKKYDIAIADITYTANASSVPLTHAKQDNLFEYEIGVLIVGDFTPPGYTV